MKKVKYLIIGAGISGLTFASEINDSYLIIEKENAVGGYCKTTYRKDFVWDYAGHFFHFKDKYFKDKFINYVKDDGYVTKIKKTGIYYNGKIIDYPFQANIHQLEKEEFIDCLYDLFNREEKENYDNFLDMLYGKFGKSIVEKFLRPYNEKLYACDLITLDKDAMGRFFPYADLKSIINNMKNEQYTSYNDTFIYPKKGAQVIINMLMEKIDSNNILLNTTVDFIDYDNKFVRLSNGQTISYEYLINTIPFNHFINLFNNEKYREVSDKLTYNKVLVFNLGFNKKSSFNKEHWLYFPDKKINFYRVGFYDNILDTNKLSMYIEIGYNKNKKINIEEQLNETLKNLKLVGIIDDTFILQEYESIIMDPAYVHISEYSNKMFNEINNVLNKKNIYTVGRYGAWTYCSMEDSMIAAKLLIDKIKK